MDGGRGMEVGGGGVGGEVGREDEDWVGGGRVGGLKQVRFFSEEHLRLPSTSPLPLLFSVPS